MSDVYMKPYEDRTFGTCFTFFQHGKWNFPIMQLSEDELRHVLEGEGYKLEKMEP